MIVTTNTGHKMRIRPGGRLGGLRITSYELEAADHAAKRHDYRAYERWIRDDVHARFIPGSFCSHYPLLILREDIS